MASITLKQGEEKIVSLAVRARRTMTPISLAGATLFLGVKRHKADADYLFSKETSDFDVSQAAVGQISVLFTAADTDQIPGSLIGELKVTYLNTNIEKSDDLDIIIEQSIT